MERYYYVNETDDIVSTSTLRSDYYEMFGQEYESFDDYLTACMWYNNGELIDVRDRIREVKEELSQKLACAQKYGYEEYSDELVNLLGELDRLGKYVRSVDR